MVRKFLNEKEKKMEKARKKQRPGEWGKEEKEQKMQKQCICNWTESILKASEQQQQQTRWLRRAVINVCNLLSQAYK